MAADLLAEIRSTLRPGSGGRHGPLPVLLLALTFLTGVVDASSYLRLGHVFVANMTGNIVFLGFALAGASGVSAPAALAAIVSFMLGALAGGWLGSRSANYGGRILRAAGSAQALFILVALALALAVAEPVSSGSRYELIVPLAVAMGMQNAAAQRLAVPEFTTTVLTKTLVGIASEARSLGGAGTRLGARGLSIAAMLLGALCGGLLVLNVSVASALALALAVSACVGALAHVLSRDLPAWRHSETR